MTRRTHLALIAVVAATFFLITCCAAAYPPYVPLKPSSMAGTVTGNTANFQVMPATGTDWTMTNYDMTYSRNSPQNVIGKNNVNQLQVKWILNTGYAIENPPLIVGNTVYVQNNAMQIIAIDLKTGLSKWKYDPHVTYTGGLLPRSSSSHGMTIQDGILYAPTGPNGTIVALNTNSGAKVWESALVDIGPAWRESAPPIIWNNIIVAGSALGDEPPFGVAQKGTVTGLDLATGKKLWQTQLAVGPWVTTSPNATQNGGATTWSGGAVDVNKGIIYLPIGNPSPDFKPDIRAPGLNKYSNEVVALNIADGKILWDTPLIAEGSGPQNLVIGHCKRGDIMAMDAATGKPVWWLNPIFSQNVNQQPSKTGTDVVWPGPGAGIESFTATDGRYLYAAGSSTPVRYYSSPPDPASGLLSEGGAVPAFDAIDNGFGNGTISAIDLVTGKIAWKYDSPYGTYVSPLVTNGVVFSGHVTDTGKPYTYSDVAGPQNTPLVPSGMLTALDTDNGHVLWEFNVGAQVGIGGPSIGNGYLIVPTGGIQVSNNGGYVMAFGLPGT